MLNMHLVELYEETNKKTDKAEIAQTNRHVTIANDKAVWASRAWVSPDPFFPIFHCQIIMILQLLHGQRTQLDKLEP